MPNKGQTFSFCETDENMITEFQGEFRWLSNFYKCFVQYEGIIFPSSEHAYVAAKTLNMEQRKRIAKIDSPGKVKRYGREITLRPGWGRAKLNVMREIVEAKFRQNPDLRQKLLDTGGLHIQEGNRWGDTFWGVDLRTGKGSNHLGKILMGIRRTLANEVKKGV